MQHELSQDLINFYQRFTTTNAYRKNENDKLATILFSDIVGSTLKLSSYGDKKWKDLMNDHDKVVKEKVKKYSGQFIKSTGDGALVVFDGPIRGIKYALEFQSEIKSLGIECRCGLHIGQIEWRGSDISGIAVNIASRVMDLSQPNRVSITKTLGDLISGSRIDTKSLGLHTLKGINDNIEILEVLT